MNFSRFDDHRRAALPRGCLPCQVIVMIWGGDQLSDLRILIGHADFIGK